MNEHKPVIIGGTIIGCFLFALYSVVITLRHEPEVFGYLLLAGLALSWAFREMDKEHKG